MDVTTKAAGPLDRISLGQAAAAASLVALAAIGGAWFFQLVIGLAPCPLCLEQRIPYYIGIPLALLAWLLAARAPRLSALLLAGFALAMAVVTVMAVYHAGVEWKWWQGPTDCSGPLNDLSAGGGLMNQLKSVSVVRCDDAAWRLFGLSLAGYNALISAGLALLSAWAVIRAARAS